MISEVHNDKNSLETSLSKDELTSKRSVEERRIDLNATNTTTVSFR